MKTRRELWKNYRREIIKNLNLQKSVKLSTEKLEILYKRLIAIFPDYEKKYTTKAVPISISSGKWSNWKKYSLNKISKIKHSLNQMNYSQKSVNSMKNFDFSSHELDDVLQTLQKKLILNQQLQATSQSNIEVHSQKTLNLDESNLLKLKKIKIAIDGPSGSGKSTVAKIVARKLNLNYLNTGLVYRAFALAIDLAQIPTDDEEKMFQAISELNLKLLPNEEVELNGKNITSKLRSEIISQNASIISTFVKIREQALFFQQEYAKKGGIIMEGRDTTFRIMPFADVKIFLDTKAEIRAERRWQENQKLGFKSDYKKVLEGIIQRDFRDKNRENDPLHKVKDAELIDASEMTINEVVKTIINLVVNYHANNSQNND